MKKVIIGLLAAVSIGTPAFANPTEGWYTMDAMDRDWETQS